MQINFNTSIKNTKYQRANIENNHPNNIFFKGNDRIDIDLSKTLFDESLTLKHHEHGLLKDITTVEGTINNKYVSLKRDNVKTGKHSQQYKYTGLIGENEANISIKSNKIYGQIGQKNFNLEFKTKPFGYFSIKGQIGDKKISIEKNSKISQAQDENDIITAATSLMGYSFKVINGQFKNLKPSKQAITDQIELMRAMQYNQLMNFQPITKETQMLYDQAIMQQQADNQYFK